MNETEQIKDRLPIEQLVASYVPLKRAGRIYKACCPFHNEKTPSFTVSPDRGIFKCFGCGEGGDIFDFVMKLEGLTFPEAVKMLADKAGVVLETWKPPSGSQPSSGIGRDRLSQLNSYTAKLWHTILTKHEKAEVARQYLQKRGLSEETIKTFQIGYAPFGPVTGASLKKAEFSSAEISAAGDPTKFQDRITFPIWDITGRVIGFTGRLLELPDDPRSSASRGPKYWNTPETPLFIKSRAVYALHLAKHAMQKEDVAILAEGQMDVTMLHQAGYPQTVASSGTALTSEQLRLIGRFTNNLAFAYDGDKAGIEATKRGIELALAAELNPFVIVIPSGKDPADCIQQDPAAWEKAYKERLPFLEWLIRQAIPSNGQLSPQQKKEAAKELLPWLTRILDPLERNEWLRIISAHLQTDEQNLRDALSRLLPQTSATPSRQPQAEPIESPIAQESLSPLLQKAELAAALLLSFPDIHSNVRAQIPSLKLAGNTPFLNRVLELSEQSGQEPNFTTWLSKNLPQEEQKQLSLYMQDLLRDYQEVELDNSLALEEVMLILQRIRSESKEEAKARLAKDISNAQLLGDSEKLKNLFSELKNLI